MRGLAQQQKAFRPVKDEHRLRAWLCRGKLAASVPRFTWNQHGAYFSDVGSGQEGTRQDCASASHVGYLGRTRRSEGIPNWQSTHTYPAPCLNQAAISQRGLVTLG